MRFPLGSIPTMKLHHGEYEGPKRGGSFMGFILVIEQTSTKVKGVGLNIGMLAQDSSPLGDSILD